MRVITLWYIEILLQVLFRIWFLYPTLYWVEIILMLRLIQLNRAQVYSIQYRINLHYITMTSPLRRKCIITTCEKKTYINQVRNWEKNMKIYDPTPGSEKMLSHFVWDAKLVFVLDCRDLRCLRCIYSKIEKTCQWSFFRRSRVWLCQLKDRYLVMRKFT